MRVVPNLNEMPVEARLKLVQDLWDSIAADTDAVPIDSEQVEVIRKRLAGYRSDGVRGVSVRVAVERIRNNF